jgi:uncharacterized Fe-S cluster-containing protein
MARDRNREMKILSLLDSYEADIPRLVLLSPEEM